jgi:RNA polymerase sigma-70 factor (ECF subfamily)
VPNREAAFDELYATHRQTLHAFLLGRTGDAELALDLLQDTFVRVWRNQSMLDRLSTERQRGWLFSVARNLVIDHHRAAATRARTGEVFSRAAALGKITEDPVDVEVMRRERIASLDAAIARLPEDLRTVLVLQVMGEHTSSEIGDTLGRPAGTVRYQLSEARRRLALELQP